MKTTLKESELGEICWPVPEFSPTNNSVTCDLPANWNDSLYIDETVQLFDVLRLNDVNVYETDSWRDLVDQVWTYVESVVDRKAEVDPSLLYSNIQRSLQRTYRKFAHESSLLGGDTQPVAPPEMLPWTDILISCAEYRIELLQDLDRRIGYKESTLYSFTLPKAWSCGLSWSEEHKENTIREHLNISVTSFRDSICPEESYLNPDLHDLLNKEQKNSLRFEKKLEDALKENYTPDSSSFLMDIAELEKEEEMLKSKTTFETSFSHNDNREESEQEQVSILHQISPRLGLLLDSPFVYPRISGRQRQRSSGQFDLNRSWNPPTERDTAASGGKKRRQERYSSGEKRARKSFDYREEVNPEIERALTGRLDNLKYSIHHEIAESIRLDNKLKDALEK